VVGRHRRIYSSSSRRRRVREDVKINLEIWRSIDRRAVKCTNILLGINNNIILQGVTASTAPSLKSRQTLPFSRASPSCTKP